MLITENNYKEYIDKFKADFTELKNKTNEGKLHNIKNIDLLLDNILSFLFSQKNTPEELFDFITKDKNVSLPSEFEFIKAFYDWKEELRRKNENLIKQCIEKKDYKSAINIVSLMIKTDIKNIDLTDYLEELFTDNSLSDELIKLYETGFYYTSKPEYFEKIGDIYQLEENYEKATDAYLNCAEISSKNINVYKKLAGIFKKLGDDISYSACCEQIKILEENQ